LKRITLFGNFQFQTLREQNEHPRTCKIDDDKKAVINTSTLTSSNMNRRSSPDEDAVLMDSTDCSGYFIWIDQLINY